MKKLLLTLLTAFGATDLWAACFPNPLGVPGFQIVCITVTAASSVPIGGITGGNNNQVVVTGPTGTVTQDASLGYVITTKTYTIGTNQITLTAGSDITTGTFRAGSSQSTNSLLAFHNSSAVVMSIVDPTGAFASNVSGVQKMWHGGALFTMSSDAGLGWKSSTDATSGSVDLQILRDSAGVAKVTTGSSSTLAGLKVATLSVGASGTGAIDLTLGTVPSNPSAGLKTLWFDTADGFLKSLSSAGVQGTFVDTGISEQSVNNKLHNYGLDAVGTDTYAVTLSPALISYVTGACYSFKSGAANTGAATINFNSLGAKTIVKVAGGITTALADNDIRSGQVVNLCYDGTNMQMQSLLGNASGTTINPPYTQSFTSQTSVALTHSMNTLSVIVACYDNSTPPLQIGVNSLALTDVNTATVTFASSQTGNCVVSAGGGEAVAAPACTKYTVSESSLTDTDTAQTISLFTLPAQGKITGLTIKHSTAFSGGTVSALTIAVGCSATGCASNSYAPAFDIFQAAGNTAMYDDGGHFSVNFASHAVEALFTSTGGNLNTLTAGSVDIWACVVTLP